MNSMARHAYSRAKKKKNSQADEPIGGGLRMEKLCNLE